MRKTFNITASDIGVVGRFTMGDAPATVVGFVDNADSDYFAIIKHGKPGNESVTLVSRTGYNFAGPDLVLAPRKGFVAIRVTGQHRSGGNLSNRRGGYITDGSRVCTSRQDALDSISATGGEPNVYVIEVDLPEAT